MNRCFAIAWRVALLMLPWQTRWIASVDGINATMWEQGTTSVYASWIPMVIAIVFGASLWWPSRSEVRVWARKRAVLFGVAAGLLILASLFTSSATATMLWWVHAFLLTSFCVTLWMANVHRMEIATWFVIALMPHALLGVWQFLQQQINGSTLLGMATQRAWVRGASVVEYGEFRVLRAYGGFPHPNVFGGWLAAGLALIPALLVAAKTVRERYAWIACSALMAMAIVFTFSRGAWIAAIVGLIAAFVLYGQQAHENASRESLMIAGVILVAITALSVSSQWGAVATRFQTTTRLEAWSIEQRVTSLTDGMEAFLHRPFFGWGPGAALKGIADLHRPEPEAVVSLNAEGAWTAFRASLEPPHIAPLAALVELGVLGIIAMLLLAWRFLASLWKGKQLKMVAPVLAVLMVLAATDHYVWTLWAGQALAAMILIFSLDHADFKKR